MDNNDGQGLGGKHTPQSNTPVQNQHAFTIIDSPSEDINPESIFGGDHGEFETSTNNSPSSRSRPLQSSTTTIPPTPRSPTHLHLTGYSAIAISIEYMWAAGEALIIPYLAALGLPLAVAGLVWVVNPVVGIFVLPALGAASDRCTCRWGRRRPFIVGLVVLSLVGIVVLVLSTHAVVGATWVSIFLCFTSFALIDISHDSLLGLSRTLVGDLAGSQPDDVHRAEATYTALQLGGRLLALMLGSIPLTPLFPYLDGPYAHAHALFVVGGGLLATSALITCMCAKEVPLRKVGDTSNVDIQHVTPDYDKEKGSIYVGDEDETVQEKADSLMDSAPKETKVVESAGSVEFGGVHGSENAPTQGNCNQNTGIFVRENTNVESGSVKWWQLPEQLVVLLCITFVGWIANLVQAFYWTSWIPLDAKLPGTPLYLSFFLLLIDAIFSVLTVPLLTPLNTRLGPMSVLIGSEVIFLLSLIAARYASDLLWLQIVISALMGVGYCVHSNNPYVVCETILAEEKSTERRGFFSSLVNATLTAAQLIVGATAGLVADSMGGQASMLFFAVGCGGLCVLVVLAVVHMFVQKRWKRVEGARVASGFPFAVPGWENTNEPPQPKTRGL